MDQQGTTWAVPIWYFGCSGIRLNWVYLFILTVECKFLAMGTEFLALSLLQVCVILSTAVSGIGFPLSSTTLISSLFLPSGCSKFNNNTLLLQRNHTLNLSVKLILFFNVYHVHTQCCNLSRMIK